MNYQAARQKIRSGDCIAVKRRDGLLAKLTTWLTNDPHTHTGIAVWMGGRLLVSEVNVGGRHYVPLSQYVSHGWAFDVYEPKKHIDDKSVEELIWNRQQVPVSYSLFDLILVGIGSIIKLRFPRTGSGLICAADTGDTYDALGINLCLPEIPTPADVVNELRFKLGVSRA